MAYVYILRLKNGQYYTGSCRNFEIRMKQHASGFVRSTKYSLPFENIYSKKFDSYSEARAEEIRIKKWKKRRSIENLVKFDKDNLILKTGSIV